MTDVTDTNIDQIEAVEGKKGLRKKQGGFTLLEIVIALAVLAVIIGVLASGLFQSQEDAKLQAARTQIMKDFPSAIMRVVSISNSCSGIQKPRLEARGLPGETVWGEPWTVTSNASTVTVNYPTLAKDAVSLKELADGMPTFATDKASNIQSITASTDTLTIVYLCN